MKRLEVSGAVRHIYVIRRVKVDLLTTTIVAPPSNASKWQMGFNSAFKGLKKERFCCLGFECIDGEGVSFCRGCAIEDRGKCLPNPHVISECTAGVISQVS
jgi:hypothetical protein